jgi:outer membrane protein
MRNKINSVRIKKTTGKQKMFGKQAMMIFLLSTSMQATASDSISESFEGWIAGLSYSTVPSPFVGNTETESEAMPLIGYVGDRLTWLGPHLSYRLSDEGLFSARAVAELRFAGLDPSPNDPLLAGLAKQEIAVEVGFDLDVGPISFSGRQDISDKHNSSLLGVSVGNEWALTEGLILEANVNGEWQHENFVRYYYGVEAAEVSATRPAYAPDSAVNFGADILLSLILTPSSSLFFGFDYTVFDNVITDSPIVEDDSQYTAFAGFIFQL